jgi:uncharacterized protein YecA (UPF0149 family)
MEAMRRDQTDPELDTLISYHCRDATSRIMGSEVIHINNKTQRREMGKIGRNDPCPCGSGKKFKKCCS